VCSGALFGAAALTAVALARAGQAPPWGTFAAFAALMLYSEVRAVNVGSGTISPGWLISLAGIVAFVEVDALLGALLLGMVCAFDPPLLRSRAWQQLAFNSGYLGLGCLASAAALSAIPDALIDELPGALLAPVVAAAAYVAVTWPAIIVGFSLKYGNAPRATLTLLTQTSAQFLPFSFLGYFIGRLYVELGAGALLLVVVPILIAQEMFASYLKVRESHDETVAMLIHALEKKDRYTSGHSERVAKYTAYMGEEFNFGPRRMERLRLAALMHDIGKLVVPNHLLNKPGRLTEEEFKRVRLHEKVSVQMLSHIDFLRPIAKGTHSDATRFDPDDPERPIEPYMVMIADAYDAMTSTRSYRKALSQEVAFAELRDKAGTQFHPECVEALIRAIEKRGERHGAGYEEDVEFEAAPEAGLGSAGLGDLLNSTK
jgi:HD superfamily phosphodiesterase